MSREHGLSLASTFARCVIPFSQARRGIWRAESRCEGYPSLHLNGGWLRITPSKTGSAIRSRSQCGNAFRKNTCRSLTSLSGRCYTKIGFIVRGKAFRPRPESALRHFSARLSASRPVHARRSSLRAHSRVQERQPCLLRACFFFSPQFCF